MKSHSTGGALIKDPWDVVVGVVLLGFALLLLFYLIPNYIGQPPIMQNPMMSPRWLPTIVGWLLLVFSLLLITQGVLVVDDGEDSGRRFERGPWLRFALMVLALVVYVGFFELLGAIFSGILATLLLFIAHPVRTWWVYSLVIVFPVGVSLLFTEVMNVPLPMLPF
ncbi:tripartite tricarboxylate transporter TctB family protein [Halomonas sp. IOP_31]|uniref:tripartite tricarboxylate transporter TctB family protein n=1 Tax=Halomonas sp. IOP_31 TaxID=2876584 RepID=UPI001E416136|nr:tripartite tricarboxylate transporter TctB family protein [Halomonas sp. IOP_31]MCD6010097.1 tripartite tricarboxylate transporter TctB family protein [Halomonas sp. IOP_31]|tara:strand:- start:86 stop:583 length:498 start_codon:yes stop_codon:yes gene_type:complete